MDDLYAQFLMLSIVGTAALVVWILTVKSLSTFWSRHTEMRLVRKVVKLIATFSILFLSLSVFVHVFWGHRPGSAEAMTVIEFLAEHRAFPVTALAILIAMAVSKRCNAQRRKHHDFDTSG